MNDSTAQPRGRRLRLRDGRRKETEAEELAWYERQIHVVKCSRPVRSPESKAEADPEHPQKEQSIDGGNNED